METATCLDGEAFYDVIAFGDLIADFVMSIPRLPIRANEHQESHEFFLELGGTCNFLIAATHLGLRTKAIGSVGDDVYGKYVIDQLHQNGIDVSGVSRKTGAKTPLTLVLVDEAYEHVFLGLKGSATSLPSRTVWKEHLLRARVVYANGYAVLEEEARVSLVEIFQEARRAGLATFFDPGPAVSMVDMGRLQVMLEHTFCLQLTLEEATVLTGPASPREAATELLRQGPELVAIKLGSQGSLIATGEKRIHVPAIPVSVRDTTGAGDAFDAACVYGYLAGFSLQQIGWLANAYGAVTSTVVGAGTRIPNREVVGNVLRQHDVDLSINAKVQIVRRSRSE
jgi:sugar/nucleoside kinase (ribokinase family)